MSSFEFEFRVRVSSSSSSFEFEFRVRVGSGSGLSCQYNGSLDSTAVPWNTGGEWRLLPGVSRDAVHIHAKIVSTRNREISILGDVQPYLG